MYYYITILKLTSTTEKSLNMMNLTSIVFLLRVCDHLTQTSVQEFSNFWYNDFANDIEKCSFGNVNFDPLMNKVVEFNIPCRFISSKTGLLINNNRLDDTNFKTYNFEWADYIIEHIGYDISQYKYRILIYPSGTKASFYGIATVGCSEDGCYSWYNTQDFKSNLFIHEIGHNMGLDHSNTYGIEYGDKTSVMGNTPNTCWISPHRFVLGWSKPLSNISITNDNVDTYANQTYELDENEFIIVNKNLFIENVNLDNVLGPNKIVSSLNVYFLNTNLSTYHLCRLYKMYDNCQIDLGLDNFTQINIINKTSTSYTIYIHPSGSVDKPISVNNTNIVYNITSSKGYIITKPLGMYVSLILCIIFMCIKQK